MKHNPSFPSSPRSRTAGFTLVEMLAVTGIIAILTTITVAGLRGINGGTARRAAVGNLMGVFDQARMVAISDGRPTYVVFVSAPKGGQTQTTSVLPESMWGRAYALFEDKIITDKMNSADPKAFYPEQRSGWLYLPTGVAFKCNNSDGTPDSLTTLPQPGKDGTKFPIVSRSGGGSTPLTLPYVKFDAMGQIVDYTGEMVAANAARSRVLLFEGTADNTGTEVNTHPAAGNGTKYALDEIILRPMTGRAEYTLNPANNLAATP